MKRFWQNKTALAAILILTIIFLLAIFVPVFSHHPYFETNLELKNQLPSANFFFGTDELGRDLFCRTFYGARISLAVGLVAAIIDLFFGVVIGALAAFFKGAFDEILMRFCDVMHSIPYMLMVILLLVFLGPGFFTIILALTLTGWINMARIVRSRSLQILKNDYILAAYSLGASKRRIIFRHLIPNLTPIAMATVTLTIPSAIFAETFLSFLGLGIQAPIASWGVMLNDSLSAIRYFPHRLLFPSAFLSITLICFNLIGDALKEFTDPKRSL